MVAELSGNEEIRMLHFASSLSTSTSIDWSQLTNVWCLVESDRSRDTAFCGGHSQGKYPH